MRYMNSLQPSFRTLTCALVLVISMGMAGCGADKLIMPTLTDSAAEVRLPGKFVWFDLFTTDMTMASNFYDALFGWDFERTQEFNPRIKTIYHRGKAIGNMIGQEPEKGRSHWLSYMSTLDVDATLELAVSVGGTVKMAAKDMPDRGRVGVVSDPQGGLVGLVTSDVGDPTDKAGGPTNVWMGCELWTTDVDGATAFYKRLGGYGVSEVDVQGKKYVLLTKRGRHRAGIVPTQWKDMTPEWIPYIAVDNLLSILTRVEKYGGKVLTSPDMSTPEGRVALIADPSGAIVGVHQVK